MSNMKTIVQYLLITFCRCFILLVLLSVFNQTYAVTATSLSVSPVSPAYNTVFSCAITVDVDNHDVACGLVPADAATNTMPWDICPKKNGLGRQDNDTRTSFVFKCIANTDTKVPGPGNYKIVAWHFWNDGAQGAAIASLPITITEYHAPTLTPIPTQALKPTDIPIFNYSPTSTIRQQFPTQVPTQYITPFQLLSIPTVARQQNITVNSSAGFKLPSLAFLYPIIQGVTKQVSSMFGKTIEIGKGMFVDGKNFLFKIVETFLEKTSF